MQFLILTLRDQHFCAGTTVSTLYMMPIHYHISWLKKPFVCSLLYYFWLWGGRGGDLSGKQEAGGRRGTRFRVRTEQKRIKEHLYHF